MMDMLMMAAAAVPETLPAPAPEVVTIPWGDWISQIVDIALPAFGTLLTGIASYVVGAYIPAWLKAITGEAGQQRVNQLIQKAVMSAVGQTKDAVLGEKLEITVANDVLRRAMQYCVDQAPALIKQAAGGSATNLANMVMARMTELGLLPADYSKVEASKATAAPSAPFVSDVTLGEPAPPKKLPDVSFEDQINRGFGRT